MWRIMVERERERDRERQVTAENMVYAYCMLDM